MHKILKKLKKAGVSDEMIEKLKAELAGKSDSEIHSEVLESAAQKVGIDPKSLPAIDFSDIVDETEGLLGKDLNHDGKIGKSDIKSSVSNAYDQAKEKISHVDLTPAKDFVEKNATGLFGKIKSIFKK